MNYVDEVYSLAGLNDFVVPSLTEKAITSSPVVNKRREELFEQYKDQLDDPNIMMKVENELIALDKEQLKGDESNGFMIKSKNYDVQRKRMFVTMGLVESFGDETPSYSFSKTNLNDGWDLKEFDMLSNDIRRGVYDRAKSTALGGAESKMLGRNFQDSTIVEDDCGTERYLPIMLTKSNYKLFLYRNIIVGNKLVILDKETISNYIGKEIKLRSPMYCKSNDGYCYACMDTRFKDVGVKLLNVQPIGISSQFVTLSLRSQHGTKTELLNIDNLNTILA